MFILNHVMHMQILLIVESGCNAIYSTEHPRIGFVSQLLQRAPVLFVLASSRPIFHSLCFNFFLSLHKLALD